MKVTYRGPDRPLNFVATRSADKQTVFLKVVNPTGTAVEADVQLHAQTHVSVRALGQPLVDERRKVSKFVLRIGQLHDLQDSPALPSAMPENPLTDTLSISPVARAAFGVELGAGVAGDSRKLRFK
jgi:hypothetical protein